MRRVICVLFLFALADAGAFACPSPQAPDSPVPLDSEEPAPQPRRPAWLKWGVEYHGRMEWPSDADFEPGRHELYYLNRIRVFTAIEASRSVRFYVQGQDARAPGFTNPDELDAVVHHFDFRQAYAEFGRLEGAWSSRVGRQELAFGDERLVGADNYWDPLGQTFDALRITRQGRGVRIDAFGALLLTPTCQSLARPSTGNRLYGVYISLEKGPRGSVIEPYFLWKNNRGTNDGTALRGSDDVLTYGTRLAGRLPARAGYNVEMAVQGGHRTERPIRAWAGHWELGFRPLQAALMPRLGIEYNYATGDSHPGDGRHATFDDLYPAGYNKYGMADPFAWRNLRNISTGADWVLSKRWRIGLGYRTFWLAAIQDGLYLKGDLYLTRNPEATSDNVGSQASLMTICDVSQRWQVAAGFARFFPGPYLTGSAFRGQFSTPYLMVNYKFE